MHIPDGYLGPVTSGFFFAVMVPVWAAASKIVKKTLNARQVPLLAMGSAFCFVVMMLSVPMPGGTTGHPSGCVLAAILLGPWAACIAVTVTLAAQALLLGDGGITAFGANAFNMAFVMVFAGYYLYRLICPKTSQAEGRRAFAAGIAAYVGMNFAALCAGIELGLQPVLHRAASGSTLYAPYGLKTVLVMMLGEHTLVFGMVEAVVTALVVTYLQKQAPAVFIAGAGDAK